MTNPIIRDRFPFAVVAMAVGAPPKTIRNWLDRGQVVLHADEDREGLKWRRFSVWDVLRLAIVKRLVDFGLPVEVAALWTGGTLVPQVRLLSNYKNTPPDALAASLVHTTLFVWRGESYGWSMEVVREPGVGPSREIPAAVLRVDIGRIARETIDTLASVGGDD